jgi:glutamyl-tRNA reductase
VELLVFGTNHRVAPAAARDRLALSSGEARTVLDTLGNGGGGERAVRESVVLSTCTRTEVFAWTPEPLRATELLRGTLRNIKGVDAVPAHRHTFSLSGREGVHHLFRVAAGLDSLMIGEPQVLGQVRQAYAQAEAAGCCGPYLTRLFQSAVRAGKRAHAETEISKGSASLAFAAVRLATNILSDISDLDVLVVGAGRTGAQAARNFASRTPASLTIVNRTAERAEAVAVRFGGTARPFGELYDALKTVSVVVTATSAPNPVITAAALRAIMRERRGRPLVVIDIANPRDVESSAGRIPNVFLRDLDSLGDIVQENLIRRSKQIPHVERIVEEELRKFVDWYETLKVVPVLRSLRESFHRIADEEVRRHLPSFDESNHDRLERYTRSLVARLLHQPTCHLRELDLETAEGLSSLAAVKEIFQLTPDEPPKRNGGHHRNGTG